MKFLLLLITLIVIGCGSDAIPTLPAEVQAAQDAEQAARDEKIATQKGVDFDPEDAYYGAELVETSSEIGDCSEEYFKQLVYVLDEKTFYYCARENKWLAIDLRGAKGDQGPQGSVGAQGVAGRDGRDGQDGQDAVSVASNEWLDPITNEKWFIGQFVKPWDIARNQNTCPSGSRAPTLTEMTEADLRGIFAKLRVANTILINQTELIVRAEQESATSWLVHYMTLNAVPKTLNSKRVTQNDYDTNGSSNAHYSSFWQYPYYTVCKIPNS